MLSTGVTAGLTYSTSPRTQPSPRLRRADFAAFQRILSLACERFNMRLLAWVLMTNHFHLVLWPRRDGDLQAFMQWATTCHVRRYHKHYKGSGHVWQGRYRSKD